MNSSGESRKAAHPLDGSDPDECYRTMMAERTSLITARRESEDGLVKSVLQLSSALLILIAGFSVGPNKELSCPTFLLIIMAVALLVAAIVSGLTESRISSRAYSAQQELLEKYYQKEINEFFEPKETRQVRIAQTSMFVAFVGALIAISLAAIIELGEINGWKEPEPTTTSDSPAKASTESANSSIP